MKSTKFQKIKKIVVNNVATVAPVLLSSDLGLSLAKTVGRPLAALRYVMYFRFCG